MGKFLRFDPAPKGHTTTPAINSCGYLGSFRARENSRKNNTKSGGREGQHPNKEVSANYSFGNAHPQDSSVTEGTCRRLGEIEIYHKHVIRIRCEGLDCDTSSNLSSSSMKKSYTTPHIDILDVASTKEENVVGKSIVIPNAKICLKSKSCVHLSTDI